MNISKIKLWIRWMLVFVMLFLVFPSNVKAEILEDDSEMIEVIDEEEEVVEEIIEQEEEFVIDQNQTDTDVLEEVVNEEEQTQAMAKEGWYEVDDVWYYYANGKKVTGWLENSGSTYYLDSKGAMVTGWKDIDGSRFYFSKDETDEGAMLTGWHNIGSSRFYFKASGEQGVKGKVWTGWLKQGGRYYYLKKTGDNGIKGRLLTGWQNIGGKTFYFKKSGTLKGAMFVGIQNVGDYRYYFSESGSYGSLGAVQTGWQTVDKVTYYLNEDTVKGIKGRASTGWMEIGKYRFYFKKTGTYKGKMLTGWQNIGGNRYFFKRSGEYGKKGAMLKNWQNIDGKRYYFGTDGILRTNTTINGVKVGADGAVVTNKTLKSLLQTGLQPMASTLYVLGGGHSSYGTTIGLVPSWKTFYNSQNSSYENTWSSVSDRSKGLDCSGYVGWTVYNTVNTKSGGSSCSTYSYQTPKLYYDKGWGTYKSGYTAGDFKPGDVVAWKSGNTGHAWIVLGKCSDGSYVVMHSTPASGPQLTGTMTKSGKVDSEAAKLAKKYMDKYYSGKVKKMSTFPSIGAVEYVFGPGRAGLYRFSWDLTGSKALSDPDGYSKMSAAEILEDLF